MILCVISMFIYVCECIGLRNIVIMMYMYLTMLKYPINDLNAADDHPLPVRK
jgi:hypothetical protein